MLKRSSSAPLGRRAPRAQDPQPAQPAHRGHALAAHALLRRLHAAQRPLLQPDEGPRRRQALPAPRLQQLRPPQTPLPRLQLHHLLHLLVPHQERAQADRRRHQAQVAPLTVSATLPVAVNYSCLLFLSIYNLFLIKNRFKK